MATTPDSSAPANPKSPKGPRRDPSQAPENGVDYFSGLPEELLEKIVNIVSDNSTGHASLRSISLQSAKFNRITAPYLYQQHHLNIRKDSRSKTSIALLRTLLSSSDLADLVYQLKEVEAPEAHQGAQDDQKAQEMQQVLLDAVRQLQYPNQGMWNEMINHKQDTDYHLESALIISLTQNLEILALRDAPKPLPKNERPLILVAMSQAALGQQFGNVHQFQHLRRLIINLSGLFVDRISSILRLDSLRELILDHVEERDDERLFVNLLNPGDLSWRTWDCPHGTSKITNLCFTTAHVPLESLQNTVRSCESLTTFAFEAAGYPVLSRYYYRLTEDLANHHPQLKHLRLLDVNGNKYAHFHVEAENGVPHLWKLKHLEYLEIEACFLMDITPPEDAEGNTSMEDSEDGETITSLTSILPESLQTLVLHYDNVMGTFDDHMAMLLHNCSTALPLLKKIAIIQPRGPGIEPPNEEEYPSWKDAFANIDVHFDWVFDWSDIELKTNPSDPPDDPSIESDLLNLYSEPLLLELDNDDEHTRRIWHPNISCYKLDYIAMPKALDYSDIERTKALHNFGQGPGAGGAVPSIEVRMRMVDKFGLLGNGE